MSGDGLVVGVDVATGDVRVSCVDAAGEVVARGSAALPAPERPAPGHAEQDARSWWPAARAALRAVTDELGARRSEIRSLAVAATSGTVVLVDRGGHPVGPALMYDDRRASAEAERAQEAGRERWARLGLAISASFGLSKLGWLAARPAARGAARACHTPDLILRALCGEAPPTDSSHALKSGYDALAGEWAREVLSALGVPLEWLPEVRRPTSVVGAVSARAAEQTGLPAGCELRLGMTDGCAGQLACGATEPGRFVSVLGTTLVLKGVAAELVVDPDGAVYCHRHPDGPWLPGGASSTGGEAIAEFGRERLSELDERAARRGPSSVLAYPLRRSGERFPFVAAHAEGWVRGEPEDEGDAYRGALEGVAFLERLAYAHLAELGAPARGSIAAAGGAGRSAVWTRIRATVLGRPLAVAERADTAFGAALLAAAGSLHADLGAASAAMTRAGVPVEPDPAEREPLEERYRAWTRAMAERGWITPALAVA